MKAKYLLVAGLLLAGCAKPQSDTSEAAVKEYFATMVAPPRKYEPIKTTPIARPSHAKPMADEQWYSHQYKLTDSAGKSIVREDTVVIEANGRVMFY